MRSSHRLWSYWVASDMYSFGFSRQMSGMIQSQFSRNFTMRYHIGSAWNLDFSYSDELYVWPPDWSRAEELRETHSR